MMKIFLKHTMFIFCLSLFCLSAVRAESVRLEITDGIYNTSLKQQMESNASKLLTEINNAQAVGRDLNFTGIGITSDAKENLTMLWEGTPFCCEESEIVERCLNLHSSNGNVREYQIRNIPLMMKPLESSYNDELYQEAVLCFDLQGNISDFSIAIGINQYKEIMEKGMELDDLERRMMVLQFVEQFRTAYNRKNMDYLYQIFSEDAIIITGKVIKSTSNEIGISSPKVEYTVQSKKQYLDRLAKVFAANEYINVEFSDIKVMRNGALSGPKSNFYGVTVKQDWYSSSYSDKGYVFLLWDFNDEDHPQIHVRTWQPYYLDEKTKEELPEDEIFTLDDFKLP